MTQALFSSISKSFEILDSIRVSLKVFSSEVGKFHLFGFMNLSKAQTTCPMK